MLSDMIKGCLSTHSHFPFIITSCGRITFYSDFVSDFVWVGIIISSTQLTTIISLRPQTVA